MKNPKLRAYQRTAIESARRALTKSGSCILQMPTGAGKTRAATEIVATSRGVIWFVCHRQEIERQAAKAFTAAGIDFGVVSPRGDLEPKKRVQIVSVHTLPKRIKKLPAPKLVIWDECHHVAAKSWAAIRAKLKDARHLGLTATPERLDGKGLGEWFAELVTGPGIAELIKKGFLSEFRYFAPSDPDLTSAKLQAGDYKKSDLGRVMNTPVLIGDAVREYRKNAKGKRALAFCASVEASQALADRFNKDGIKATHVDGTTPTTERDAAVQDLAAGRIKVLCNVEVFTEGFDLPAIDAVILMRPTKSPTLLLQMIGRGLRKAPGKDVAIIMDHAGLHRDHAWFADDWQWSLDGGAAKARRAGVARGPRRCPECKEVRAEREPVCGCGYEFQSGREIGEFDGVLTEVRGVVPEGCVSISEFSRMMNVSHRTVREWLDDGMPGEPFLIPVDNAKSWLLPRNLSVIPPMDVVSPDEFERVGRFSERTGIRQGTISFWKKEGMPHASNGWIHIKPALEWIAQKDYRENIRQIARRRKMPVNAVTSALRDVCRTLNGYDPSEADAAIDYHLKNNRCSIPPNSRAIRLTDYAKRIGRKVSSIYSLIHRGMPLSAPGWVVPERVDAWRKENDRAYTEGRADEYENRSRFGARLGYGKSYSREMCAKLAKLGLPCASNGWVHIQRGLEWVRDNTDIKIPDSAWPKKVARVKRNRPPAEHHAGA